MTILTEWKNELFFPGALWTRQFRQKKNGVRTKKVFKEKKYPGTEQWQLEPSKESFFQLPVREKDRNEILFMRY